MDEPPTNAAKWNSGSAPQVIAGGLVPYIDCTRTGTRVSPAPLAAAAARGPSKVALAKRLVESTLDLISFQKMNLSSFYIRYVIRAYRHFLT
jgi:hypothetical protein